MNARDKRIERAQMRVLFQVPFFAPAVARLPVLWDESIPTACTDGKVIRANPEWIDKLPDGCLPTVLCHEAEHCLLGHMWRAPHGADWDRWNQATDHAVNLGLGEFSAVVMGKRLADPFPFPEPKGAYCADPRFAGMAEEAIYAALASPSGGGGGGKPGKGRSGGQGGQSGPGGSGKGKSEPAPGSMPSFGQMSQPQNGQASQAAQKRLQNDWQATLIQSVQMAAGRGDCPGSLERLVNDIVSPRVPWQQILKSWLREQCADDWDFLTPDLTMDGSGFILPSLRSDRMGAVVFGSDWSGSTCGLVDTFHAEKQACLDDMRPAKLIDIGFDTAIGWEREYVPGETIIPEIRCGGGTDFRPLFARLEEMQPAPKCLVILTDCDGTMPDDPPSYPVIWISYGGGTAPFGLVVPAGDMLGE